MDKNTWLNLQLAVGVIAIIFWIVNFFLTGIMVGRWYIGTDNTVLLLLGILGIATWKYSIKNEGRKK
jgi:hypothetical protein